MTEFGFRGIEEELLEALDSLMEDGYSRIAHGFGVDPAAFSELKHSYDDGVYRGIDISEGFGHYGTPRHSGRYPWGSGDNPYQRNASFLGKVEQLTKAKGPDGKKLFTEKQIAEAMGMNTSELRKRKSLANAENRAYEASEAKRLKEKGMSTSAIARRMGKNESSVRLLLDEEVNERMSKNVKNATLLKQRLDQVDYIDVGKGSEEWLGMSSTAMGNTLHLLEKEGYTIHDIQVEQQGTGKMTTTKVLAKPGVEWKEVYNNRDKIGAVTDMGLYSDDGNTMKEVKSYVSIDPKRVAVKYPSEGGDKMDGMIELRPGVDDISLGRNHYAQVRLLIDKDHYAKGMAVYSDDLPPGVDIRINTSKPDGTPMFKRDGAEESVLKPAKKGQENPFGANLKPDEKLTKAQKTWTDENGVEHQSAINIVKEEGDVNDWNRTLPSQFLSKQTPALAKQQLNMAVDISKSDMAEIASYTNPIVKASMLEDFAGRCESDAVHLAAAALPRQSNKFLLSLPNNKENEVYAPGYRDGEEVALIRFPHAGRFEIAKGVVNNNNKEAQKVIGDPGTVVDAIGVNPKMAAKLSGADFDGDTVLVIPTSSAPIQSKDMLSDLKGFNETFHEQYKKYDGMHVMTSREHGLEMGKISNLITDMTIQGAPDDKLARAVKHSMVVVDAQKHELDYKRSERENRIDELRREYQMKPNGTAGGASTLLSRSTSELHIPERKLKAPSLMTPEEKERYKNGEQIWVETGKSRTFRDPKASKMTAEERKMWETGDKELQRQVRASMAQDGRLTTREVPRKTDTTKGAYVDNAFELATTGDRRATTPIERVYGDYANQMKDLARQARAMARKQEDWKADPEARKKYAAEVQSLDEKLSKAKRNAPLERMAQRLAEKNLKQVLTAHPELKDDKEHYKREKGRQLDAARKKVGAKKWQIGTQENPLTDREWEAIEHHAVSKSKLQDIISQSDKGRIRELAMPKTHNGLAPAKKAKAKAMLNRGYSRAEVCDMLDISQNTLIKELDL